MIVNFVNELDLNGFISNVFTLSLIGCLFLHLILTKQKRLVSFCMFMVIVQFGNWQLVPWLMSHNHGKFLWYVTLMASDILILLYVAYKSVTTGKVLKEELAVSVFTIIAIAFYLGRFIERHYTEFSLIKGVQAYAIPAVNICIIIILAAPILKQLVLLAGKHVNGITIFGLRFSVSSVRSNAVLADTKGLSKQKHRVL